MNKPLFDDETFFAGYRALRQKGGSYNDLIEQPAMAALLPPLEGAAVLDLGCGCGHNCVDFIARGAARVVGGDVSQKMLAVARRENAHPGIEYREMGIEDVDGQSGSFDLVYSSLALHYIEDFPALSRRIFRLLRPGGIFLFSQEHPTTTAPCGGPAWARDEEGRKTAALVSDYGREGRRSVEWFIEGVEKSHRMFSTLVNSLTGAGFLIDRVVEPLPDEETLAAAPPMRDEYHKPSGLIFRAKRP